MVDAMLQAYVAEEGKIVTNGFRSIGHETNVQAFLERFGFRKVYCDLRVTYRRELGWGIRCLYPFRHLIDRVSGTGPRAVVRILLEQEHIRRSFL
jgi:hypothetical protein